MHKFSVVFCLMVCAALVASGASFGQCPAVGADTLGCELLITVTAVNGAGAATVFSVATASPDQGPYDSAEDTLIGIVNSASAVLNSISFTNVISGGVGAFGFDGDGACSAGFLNCVGTDSTGYGGPGVTFSAISGTVSQNGTVNFTPGVASGKSAWWSLEGPVTAQTISGTPEPASLALIGTGLGALYFIRRRRSA